MVSFYDATLSAFWGRYAPVMTEIVLGVRNKNGDCLRLIQILGCLQQFHVIRDHLNSKCLTLIIVFDTQVWLSIQ